MDLKKGSRIAVIGAGISGIAAANILKKNGFVPVVFEKHERIGGVWATAYPEVHLQNIYPQYRLSDLDWSFKPELHPTGEQIMRYLSEAVQSLQLDIRLGHEVLEMKEQPDGDWRDVSNSVELELKKDRNEMIFRTMNVAGVTGPEHKIIIER